jgi:hypothetical protein
LRKQLAELLGCRESDVDVVVKSDQAARRELTRRGFLGAALALAAAPAPARGRLVAADHVLDSRVDRSSFCLATAYWTGPREPVHHEVLRESQTAWQVAGAMEGSISLIQPHRIWMKMYSNGPHWSLTEKDGYTRYIIENGGQCWRMGCLNEVTEGKVGCAKHDALDAEDDPPKRRKKKKKITCP